MERFGGVTDSFDLQGAKLEELSAAFATRLDLPRTLRSVAEMRLVSGDISWLNNWFGEHAKEVLSWTSSSRLVQRVSGQQMFGFLFLIFASETAREVSKEDSIWPSISSALSDTNGLKQKLFPQGQPSNSLKAALEDGARCFSLRHVLDSDEGYDYKYFDTVKLQFGFTFHGACNRLHEWLIGQGIPVSVRVLLGQEPKYSGLTSSSFQHTWDTLLLYRREVISRDQAKKTLQNSPWVRPDWIDRLLHQATIKHEQTNRPLVGLEQPESPIIRLGLHWPHSGAPHIELTVNHHYITQMAARTTSHQLVFLVNDKPLARWLRQQDNSWSGKDRIPCEPGASVAPTLRPSQLTIVTHEGEVLEETDLTTLFELRRDVIIFDLGEGLMLRDEDIALNTRKEYALITNADLDLKGIAVVDWQRVGDAKIYRLTPPWPADVRLTLDDLEFWSPNIENATERLKVSLSLVALENRPIQMGSMTRLSVQGIPLETLAARLLLGSKTTELRREGSSWCTLDVVEITPDLVLGLQKKRVELRDGRSRRTHPVKAGFDVLGTLVHERDMDSDYTRWRIQRTDQPLNIASGGTEIRFFSHAALGEQTLMEGVRTVGQLPKRTTRLPGLGFYGWGARLTTEDETQILADSVEDRGCVYYSRHKLFGRHIPASLSLRTPVEPSQEHSVKVWINDECNPARIQSFQGSDLVTKSGGQLWEITRKLPKLNAISVAYRGKAIGQWWDKEEIARVIKGRQSAEVFALLRWFKVPVLSTQLVYNMQGAVHRDPLSFLRAWLLSEELPEGLSQKNVDEGVKSVVRHFLWGWSGKPYMVKKMLELLTRASGQVPPGVDAGLLRAAEICPSLIWQNQFYIMSKRATALREFLVRQDEHESQSSSKFHKPQEPVRRRYRAYGKQIDAIKSALSSDEFSVMILLRENRRLGETQEGRRMLSVLILEEIEKRATQ